MCERPKIGKACGPDDLGAEHLLYAHPALIVHPQDLFKLILCHRFVPNSFDVSVTILLVKDKMGNINDVNNYRGITLSPIISKLFEVVLLSMCNDVLKTDSLQFGFEEKVFYCNESIKKIYSGKNLFLPAKTIFAGPVFFHFFPPSGKNLPTLLASFIEVCIP